MVLNYKSIKYEIDSSNNFIYNQFFIRFIGIHDLSIIVKSLKPCLNP